MFEEYLLFNKPVTHNEELPSVVRVGAFNHQRALIPILFPFETTNGICFVTKDDYDSGVTRQMEYLALELLKEVKSELLKLTFIDIGISTRYPIINALKHPSVSFITNPEQLHEELQNITSVARYISTQCLGYQYHTLAEYNKSTPNKEPYHVFFISNFPKDFSENDLRQLSILIREAKSCGVHFVLNISREHLNGRSQYYSSTIYGIVNDIFNNLSTIDCVGETNTFQKLGIPILNRFVERFGYICDSYSLSQIEQIVQSLHVVDNDNKIPNFISVPIGRCGRDVVNFEMGQGIGIYHGFIAGQSGTGKSNLLNNIITTIAQKYPPDELRLYLLDYKWGVEFQIYANHPNVEMLMLDNTNIKAGIDVLQQLKQEMISRARQFFELGPTINNIDEYNKKGIRKLPHILVIVDEVQQLFNEFEIRRQVNPLVKDIAKQGRAFGIHLLFSSQSYVDCKIDDDILSQMPLRIAFTLSNSAECRAILGGDNTAPMKLPPYTAIFNTKNGDKDYNVVVKTDYFDKEMIGPILNSSSARYGSLVNFKKKIMKGQSFFIESDTKNSSSTDVTSQKRKEFEGVDFEKEFGF